jgi:signal peptidase I
LARKRKQTADNGKRQPTRPLRQAGELVLSLALAAGAALLIKWSIFDVYSIPTGSMEPVLQGREYSGDRVFCFKQAFRLREESGPERWEIFVFEFPPPRPGHEHAGTNYIKRCVGRPGEKVYVRDGDLWIVEPGSLQTRRAVKPPALQQSLWIPVYRSRFRRESEAALAHFWQRVETDGAWAFRDGALVGQARGAVHLTFRPGGGAPGPGEAAITDRHVKRQVVTFRCPAPGCGGLLRKTVRTQQLTAYCPRCGAFLTEADIEPTSFEHPGIPAHFGEQPSRASPYHAVRDLRLACRLRPLGDAGTVVLTLTTDRDAYEAHLPLGGGRARLLASGRTVAEGALAWPAGGASVSLWRWDGQVQLRLDGAVLLAAEAGESMPDLAQATRSSGAGLSLVGGAAAVDSIRLDRDIHYFFQDIADAGVYFGHFPLGAPAAARERDELQLRMNRDEYYFVPSGGYLALGDNQPTSNDSRAWGPVPAENLVGPALFIWWPPHRVRILQ